MDVPCVREIPPWYFPSPQSVFFNLEYRMFEGNSKVNSKDQCPLQAQPQMGESALDSEYAIAQGALATLRKPHYLVHR